MELKMKASDLNDVIGPVKSVRKASDGDTEGLVVFKKDRWLVKSRDPSNIVLAAVKVPESAMTTYKPGGVKKLGINFTELDNFIPSGKSPVQIQYDEDTRKLYLHADGTTLETSTVAPEYISGSDQDFPNVPYQTKISGIAGRINSFVSKASNVVGSATVVMEARENNFYLFSTRDNRTMVNDTTYDTFDQADIGECPVSTRVSASVISSMYKPDGESMIHLHENAPIKLTFSNNNDIPVTYFIAPRLSKDDSAKDSVPESALNDEDL